MTKRPNPPAWLVLTTALSPLIALVLWSVALSAAEFILPLTITSSSREFLGVVMGAIWVVLLGILLVNRWANYSDGGTS